MHSVFYGKSGVTYVGPFEALGRIQVVCPPASDSTTGRGNRGRRSAPATTTEHVVQTVETRGVILVHGTTDSRRLVQGVNKQGRSKGPVAGAQGGPTATARSMAAWQAGVSGERGAAIRRVCRAGVGDWGRIETNQADELQEGRQELLESLDDRWGPPQNRGLNRYPGWSWVTISSLHILKLGLQKRFGGLNLKAPTGVALNRQ
jgi:hypothetical protein